MATVSPTSVMLVNINFSKKVVRLVLVVYLKKKRGLGSKWNKFQDVLMDGGLGGWVDCKNVSNAMHLNELFDQQCNSADIRGRTVCG